MDQSFSEIQVVVDEKPAAHEAIADQRLPIAAQIRAQDHIPSAVHAGGQANRPAGKRPPLDLEFAHGEIHVAAADAGGEPHQRVGKNLVVAVEKVQIVAGGRTNPRVARGRLAAVAFVAQEAEIHRPSIRRKEPFGRRRAVVRAAVVHQHTLDVQMGLGRNGGQATLKVRAGIVNRNDDGHFHWRGSPDKIFRQP